MTHTYLQLYNLSPESERKEFLDKLFDFMQKKGRYHCLCESSCAVNVLSKWYSTTIMVTRERANLNMSATI